jgi:hypothetical protein
VSCGCTTRTWISSAVGRRRRRWRRCPQTRRARRRGGLPRRRPWLLPPWLLPPRPHGRRAPQRSCLLRSVISALVQSQKCRCISANPDVYWVAVPKGLHPLRPNSRTNLGASQPMQTSDQHTYDAETVYRSHRPCSAVPGSAVLTARSTLAAVLPPPRRRTPTIAGIFIFRPLYLMIRIKAVTEIPLRFYSFHIRFLSWKNSHLLQPRRTPTGCIPLGRSSGSPPCTAWRRSGPRRGARSPRRACTPSLQSKRLLIEAWWVSQPLAFAGKLRPWRLNK